MTGKTNKSADEIECYADRLQREINLMHPIVKEIVDAVENITKKSHREYDYAIEQKWETYNAVNTILEKIK